TAPCTLTRVCTHKVASAVCSSLSTLSVSVVCLDMALRLRLLARQLRVGRAAMSSNTDSAGSVRAAGGSFSKKEQAQEDQYFHNLELEKLRKLREETEHHHQEEIDHHKESIEDLEEQIRRHKRKIERHKKKLPDSDSDSD
ncbi:ATPase inhibitor, mitochondrial, partial [Geodia barretti]